jgi:hypothetical protein
MWLLEEASAWLAGVTWGGDVAGLDVARLRLLAATAADRSGDAQAARRAARACLDIATDADMALVRAEALVEIAGHEYVYGPDPALPPAEIALDEALAIYRDFDDRWGEGRALATRAHVQWFNRWDAGAARETARRAAAIFRSLGDHLNLAECLGLEAQAALRVGDDRALGLAAEAQAIVEELGVPTYRFDAEVVVAEWERLHGDPVVAAARHAATCRRAVANGQLFWSAALSGLVAWSFRAAGDTRAAASWLGTSLEWVRRRGVLAQATWVVESAAGLLAAAGWATAAAELFGAAARSREETGAMPEWDLPVYLADVALARGALAPAEFAAAWERGAALDISAAAELAAEHLAGLVPD